MKLLIDVQGCQSSGSARRGIGRYVRELVNALLEAAPGHDIHLLVNESLGRAEDLRAEAFPAFAPRSMTGFHVPRGCSLEAGRPARMAAARELRAWAIERVAPDLLLVASPFEGLADATTVELPPRPVVRTAAIVYDIIPALYPDIYLADATTRGWYEARLAQLKKADLLLTISDSVRREVCEAWPDLAGRTVNISSAARAPHPPGDGPPAGLTDPAGGSEFILYTGGMDWRKNMDRLIEAYGLLPGELRRRFKLVIVCALEPHHAQKLHSWRKRAGVSEEELVFTGYVPDAQLADLYRRCALFVFPSLHEGFGLPILEAMWQGAAVIGSDRSSIPEVIGLPEALFDPTDAPSMARLIERGLSDRDFAARLRAHAVTQRERFSWQATACTALRALERTAEAAAAAVAQPAAAPAVRAPAPSAAKPRLAFFSPLPPAPSGIADYAADLLPELARRYDITLVCEQALPSFKAGEHALAVRDAAWFRQHAQEFERRVYQFGNSRFHAGLFELARDYPGVVVLHDFMLGGAVQWAEEVLGREGFLAQSLLASHGKEALDFAARQGRPEAIERYPMNRQVLLHATGVIVHSRYAVAEAQRWYGPDAARGWHRIAQPRRLPSPSRSRAEARRALGLPEDALLVCSFGHIAESKLAHRIVAAFGASAMGADRAASLVLVGEVAGTLCGMQLREAMARLPDPARARVTGFAQESTYEAYLQAADIAVQLRTQSRGETSRAILDCLAHGVPLVINANGANAEYPGDVMVQVVEDFSDAQLSEALDALARDSARRRQLGAAGAAWFLGHHQPGAAAQRYEAAIEAAMERPLNEQRCRLIQALADGAADASDADLLEVSEAVAKTLAAHGRG